MFILAAHSLAQFSALQHIFMKIHCPTPASPLPHPATRATYPGWQISPSRWPSGPFGLLLACLAARRPSPGLPGGQAHNASLIWASRYAAGVTVVTPTAFPTSALSRLRTVTAPRSRSVSTAPRRTGSEAETGIGGAVLHQWFGVYLIHT